MTTIDQYKAMSVGQITTADFRAAAIFREFGIDFCCHGDDDFTTACHKAQVDPILVVKKLQQLQEEPFQIQNIQFANWPIDLLMDLSSRYTTEEFAKKALTFWIYWTK